MERHICIPNDSLSLSIQIIILIGITVLCIFLKREQNKAELEKKQPGNGLIE